MIPAPRRIALYVLGMILHLVATLAIRSLHAVTCFEIPRTSTRKAFNRKHIFGQQQFQSGTKYHIIRRVNQFLLFDTCNPIQTFRLQGWFDNLFPEPIDAGGNADSTSRLQKFPEQWPATYEVNNVNIAGETGPAAVVRVLLKNTQLESRPLQVVYDASIHGWNAQSFHQSVDGKGAAVVLCSAHDGRWFGGYNPKGWASTGGARPSVASFLFYSKTNTMDNTLTFQKLRKVGGGGLACARDDCDTGIWLGADGLVISLNDPSHPNIAKSKLGTYYERGPDNMPSLFDKGVEELAELKILVGVYEIGEAIPYSGAVLDFTSG